MYFMGWSSGVVKIKQANLSKVPSTEASTYYVLEHLTLSYYTWLSVFLADYKLLKERDYKKETIKYHFTINSD